MQSSHPACFTPKSTSIFPKHLNAVVGSPGLVPSQVLGDGLQDAENGSELFQQQAQAVSTYWFDVMSVLFFFYPLN